MAINPMQKKSRNSFLLGMILTLVICMIIGGVCYFFITTKNKEKEVVRGQEVLAYVLNQNVKSGQEITSNMLSEIQVFSNMIPANYVNASQLITMEMQDEEGNVIYTNSIGELYMEQADETSYKLTTQGNNQILIEKDTKGYYKTKKIGGDKEYIKLINVPVIAKVDMYANTVLTLDVLDKSDEIVTNDTRLVEYNMITLPTTVTEGDYIDIRLSLPNGQDYIVVSKAKVMSIQDSTIGLYLAEEEILMMNSAIVEAYIMTASNFYAVQYVEAGNQTMAGVTYTPTEAAQKLIAFDSNIVSTARKVLSDRFDAGVRTYIDASTGMYATESKTNIETGFQEQIEAAKQAREKYLQSIAAPADTIAY